MSTRGQQVKEQVSRVRTGFFLLIFQVLGWYLTFSMHGQLYFVLFISIWTAVITAAEHHAYHTVPQYTRMLL